MIHESRLDLSREELSRVWSEKKMYWSAIEKHRIADGYEIVADITES